MKKSKNFAIARLAAAAVVGIASVTGAAHAADSDVSPSASTYKYATVSIQANDLVWNASNGLIYLSIPSTAGTRENTVTLLNPATQKLGKSVNAGSEPDKMAVSDDGQFLYVGLDGASSVKRYVLPDLTPDITIDLGSSQFLGPNHAGDIEVAPGAPHTVAISRQVTGFSPDTSGVAIYDDGVQRSKIFGADGFPPATTIQWGSSPSALFGGNGADSGFDLYTMIVGSDGIDSYQDYTEAFDTYSLSILFHDGLIYSSDGRVTNPANGNEVGSYAGFGLNAINTAGTKVFFIVPSYESQPGTVTIQAFNLRRYTLESTIQIPVNGTPKHLIAWGKAGLAFNTDSGQVVLVTGAFVQ